LLSVAATHTCSACLGRACVRACVRACLREQSLCEALLQLDWSCARNFCPECLNAGFCDRTCGYCEDPCAGHSAQHSHGVHPGTPYSTADDRFMEPPGGTSEGQTTGHEQRVLLSLACFTSFMCACTVVFVALTKRRVNARLGVATTRTGRSARQDDDVMTVNARWSWHCSHRFQ
jgi:hypothetical protein